MVLPCVVCLSPSFRRDGWRRPVSVRFLSSRTSSIRFNWERNHVRNNCNWLRIWHSRYSTRGWFSFLYPRAYPSSRSALDPAENVISIRLPTSNGRATTLATRYGAKDVQLVTRYACGWLVQEGPEWASSGRTIPTEDPYLPLAIPQQTPSTNTSFAPA